MISCFVPDFWRPHLWSIRLGNVPRSVQQPARAPCHTVAPQRFLAIQGGDQLFSWQFEQGARMCAASERACAPSRKNVSVPRLKRPPTSTPKTTSLHRRALRSSGYVLCFRSEAWFKATPGSASAPGRGSPSRRKKLTIVVSTTIWNLSLGSGFLIWGSRFCDRKAAAQAIVCSSDFSRKCTKDRQ